MKINAAVIGVTATKHFQMGIFLALDRQFYRLQAGTSIPLSSLTVVWPVLTGERMAV